MEIPHDDITGTGSDDSISSLHRRFHANFKMLQEQEAEIHRLKQENLDQKHLIGELAQQAQRSNQMSEDKQESETAQLRRELAGRDQTLQEQDVAMIEATVTIEMLMRDVQVAREAAVRAEQAQREAEADQMLRHVLEDSEDDGADPGTTGQLWSELERVASAEQQSSRRVSELEQELALLRETAERLSTELRESKDDRQELELKMQREREALQQLETTKAKAAEESEHWKAVANLRQELLMILQTQVKTMCSNKENLEHAIACCQRSADKRLQVLDQDRQNIETENSRLRTELTSIQQNFKSMDLKFREIEENGFNETSEVEEALERRLVQALAHQEQLAGRITKVEQELVFATSTNSSADMAARKQQQESQNLLVVEKNELIQQLEDERRQFKELRWVTSMFKKATASALKELKEVEIELRAINSGRSSSYGQHEPVVSLAKQVVAEFKGYDQHQSLTMLIRLYVIITPTVQAGRCICGGVGGIHAGPAPDFIDAYPPESPTHTA